LGDHHVEGSGVWALIFNDGAETRKGRIWTFSKPSLFGKILKRMIRCQIRSNFERCENGE
jgi:hypothetical protein